MKEYACAWPKQDLLAPETFDAHHAQGVHHSILSQLCQNHSLKENRQKRRMREGWDSLKGLSEQRQALGAGEAHARGKAGELHRPRRSMSAATAAAQDVHLQTWEAKGDKLLFRGQRKRSKALEKGLVEQYEPARSNSTGFQGVVCRLGRVVAWKCLQAGWKNLSRYGLDHHRGFY